MKSLLFSLTTNFYVKSQFQNYKTPAAIPLPQRGSIRGFLHMYGGREPFYLVFEIHARSTDVVIDVAIY